jgi:hypothetical protein
VPLDQSAKTDTPRFSATGRAGLKNLNRTLKRLIDQVFLNPAVGGQQMGRERLTESWFGVESADHFRFLDPHHAARS